CLPNIANSIQHGRNADKFSGRNQFSGTFPISLVKECDELRAVILDIGSNKIL
ncbi:hypothetical protein Ancab_021227, partial [Ancistrocladus abbreviatus]